MYTNKDTTYYKALNNTQKNKVKELLIIELKKFRIQRTSSRLGQWFNHPSQVPDYANISKAQIKELMYYSLRKVIKEAYSDLEQLIKESKAKRNIFYNYIIERTTQGVTKAKFKQLLLIFCADTTTVDFSNGTIFQLWLIPFAAIIVFVIIMRYYYNKDKKEGEE